MKNYFAQFSTPEYRTFAIRRLKIIAVLYVIFGVISYLINRSVEKDLAEAMKELYTDEDEDEDFPCEAWGCNMHKS